jgi:excisionase family DNA binding protein
MKKRTLSPDPYDIATSRWMQEAPRLVRTWLRTTLQRCDLPLDDDDEAAIERCLPTAKQEWDRTIATDPKTYAWAKTEMHGWLRRWPERGEELLTVREVAARLKVSTETVRIWLRKGRMRGNILSAPMGWRVPESEVQRVLLAGRQGTDTEGE